MKNRYAEIALEVTQKYATAEELLVEIESIDSNIGATATNIILIQAQHFSNLPPGDLLELIKDYLIAVLATQKYMIEKFQKTLEVKQN